MERYFVLSEINKWEYVEISEAEAWKQTNVVLWEEEEDIKEDSGSYKNGEDYRAAIVMLHTQFHALVEGEDFEINALGEITLKH